MTIQNSRVRLTAQRVASFTCPSTKSQAFLWDTDSPALLLRATPTGRKTYAFEGRIGGKTIRVTIGTATDWRLEQARLRAAELKVLVDSGFDPREVEAQKNTERKLRSELTAAQSATVQSAWDAYIQERRSFWGELHYRDHVDKSKAGGQKSLQRGKSNERTTAGPLWALMHLRLGELDLPTLERWAKSEGTTRPTSARLSWRLFTVFLNWCTQHPTYSIAYQNHSLHKSRKVRELLGKPGVKSDTLTREQLKHWFKQVQEIPNTAISAALQTMLLTGARPGEVLNLRWTDIDTQWKQICFKDKVEGTREIPLTNYVEHLITSLPKRNKWVFSSSRVLMMDEKNIRRRQQKAVTVGSKFNTSSIMVTSQSGRISEPNTQHTRACRSAGIDNLTLHGLRRSFSSLTEWLEIPTGIVAQIQGHKPSATAEKHYKRRPLDLLRLHHQKIETWFLQQAEVKEIDNEKKVFMIK